MFCGLILDNYLRSVIKMHTMEKDLATIEICKAFKKQRKTGDIPAIAAQLGYSNEHVGRALKADNLTVNVPEITAAAVELMNKRKEATQAQADSLK